MKVTRRASGIEPLEPRRLLAAAAGDLDPSWGTDGVRVYYDIPAPAVGVATQSDGKFLLAAGSTVYRFKPDGSLDKSFGHRGYVTPGFSIFGLGIDHNGRIAVGGGSGGPNGRDPQWAAARYTPTGAPDTTFNGSGQIVTHVNGPDAVIASVMALQPDGKILVGGTRYHPTTDNPYDEYDISAVAVRFDTDGSIDTAFGDNGEAFDTHLFNAVDAIAIAPNGDITLAGREDLGMTIHDEHYEVVSTTGLPVAGTPADFDDSVLFSSFRAAWYRPDGVRVLADESMGNADVYFDTRGANVYFNPLSPAGYTDDKINALLTTSDNKTLVAGDAGQVGLQRFNPDGTPDATFGFGGSQVIDLNRRKREWIDRLALLPNGDYLAVGSIGTVFADANGEGGHPGNLFVAHIKGGSHPVGALAPRAGLQATSPSPNATTFEFTVPYAAEETIDASTLDNRDLRVVGPDGYSALARLTNVHDRYNGRQRIATYTIDAPGGAWNRADNGTYTIYLRKAQVRDNRGNPAPAQILGTFRTYFPRGRHTTAAVARALSLPPTPTTAKRRLQDLFGDAPILS
jgi:uncharacterized delta-60 repeat protein